METFGNFLLVLKLRLLLWGDYLSSRLVGSFPRIILTINLILHFFLPRFWSLFRKKIIRFPLDMQQIDREPDVSTEEEEEEAIDENGPEDGNGHSNSMSVWGIRNWILWLGDSPSDASDSILRKGEKLKSVSYSTFIHLWFKILRKIIKFFRRKI